MCGIVGKFGIMAPEVVADTCEHAWTMMSHRGTDSYGIILKRTDGKLMYIKAMESDEVLTRIKKLNVDVEWFIAHNRKASVGGINLKLAHPIISKKYGTLVIHNGTKKSLAQTFGTESDTKAIPIVLNTIKDKEVIKKALSGIGVVFAVKKVNDDVKILFHRDASRTLYIKKNENLFASEPITEGDWALIQTVGLKEMKSLDEIRSLATVYRKAKWCNVCCKYYLDTYCTKCATTITSYKGYTYNYGNWRHS